MARPHNLWSGPPPNRKFIQPPAPMTGAELLKIKHKLDYTTAHLAYALGVSYSCIVKAYTDDEIKMPLAMAVRYYLLTLNLEENPVEAYMPPVRYRLFLEAK